MAKVKAAPTTARLITLNDTDGQAYDIVPNGPDSAEVEIPNRLANSPFAKALAKDGHIILSDVGEDESDEDELRAEAEELGVKVDRRWKADRLQQEIDAARAKQEKQ